MDNLLQAIVLIGTGFFMGKYSVPYKRKKATENIKALLTNTLPRKKIVVLKKDVPITREENTIKILEGKRKDIKVLRK